MFLLLGSQVWIPQSASPGAESTAQTGREGGHFSSCDRLDREEAGAGVPGIQRQKQEPGRMQTVSLDTFVREVRISGVMTHRVERQHILIKNEQAAS